MSDKKNSNAILILVAMLIGTLMGVMIAPKFDKDYWNGNDNARELMGERVKGVMDLVAERYVDPVDYDTLTDQMMNAMLSTLDPHSRYMSPEALAKEEEQLRGNFSGIGVTLHAVNDTICVNQVIANGPASSHDIRPGDHIISVDTAIVAGNGYGKRQDEVVKMIRGPRHTIVDLGLLRHGSKQVHHVKVRRNTIATPSIPVAMILKSTTGYVRLLSFTSTTSSEFHSAVEKLKRQGMKHLIIDLRGNGGGLLSAALEIADELLPKGDMIIYTQGTHERKKEVFATHGGLFEEGEVTVMIDEYSASASEVLSGAIQDNDRGTIVGRRSFGKGLVQTSFDLPDGSALLLTVARYYTPSGRCIQRPYNKGTDEYYMEYLVRLASEDAAVDSLLQSMTDTSQAFTTKKGRTVYGGGGIQPDKVFKLTRDTLLVYYNMLNSKQAIFDVAFHYLDEHYDQLTKRYKEVDQFAQEFEFTPQMLERIVAYGETKGVKRNNASLAKYKGLIGTLFKAYIAQSLWGDYGFYRIYTAEDVDLQMLNIK